MPIYDYQCQSCNKVEEFIVMGKTKIICPVCGSSDMKQLVSLSNFRLIGDNWSRDGYTRSQSAVDNPLE